MSAIDAKALYEKFAVGKAPLSEMTDAELEVAFQAEQKGGLLPGELGIEDQGRRELALDSPAYMATEIVDPYYKEHFERRHYEVLDEAIAPYLLGQDVRISGQTHSPALYLGLVLLFTRDSYKSSMMALACLWDFVHKKIREGRDVRAMYVHQVLDKAIKKGEIIRDVSRQNKRFRKAFPEFAAGRGQWDTMREWRWPNFDARAAGEWSFTAYGETSEKTGGHYTDRFVDDWETDELSTPESRLSNWERFQAMDPLKDRTVGWCPLLIAGTTYFFDGTNERLARDGGYLVWKIPAHEGSPKAIFDLCKLNPRVDRERQKLERGLKKLERERAADLNFPKRLSWRELYACARGQGQRIYNGQMLVNPVPDGETRFDPEALDDIWCESIPDPEEMWLYIRCDPAISKKKQACDTAYVVGGVAWTGWRFVIDGWVGKENQPNKIVKTGFDLARKWQARGYTVKQIAWEAVQYQEALEKIARYGVPSRAAQEHGEQIAVEMRPCPVGGLPRHPNVSQDERILSLDGPISRRELKIWKRCTIGQRLVEQYRQFPLGGRDLADASQGLFERVSIPPKPLKIETPNVPQHMLELMERVRKGAPERPALVGGSNTVTLQSWS